MKRILLLSLFLAVGIQYSLDGQTECHELSSDDREKQATLLALSLQKGVLAVRLTSSRRKLEKMIQLIESDKVAESNKNELKEEIEKVAESRDRKAHTLMNAFKKNYFFSEVVFFWDKDQKFVNNPEKTIWLNEELQYSNKNVDTDKIAAFLVDGLTKETSIAAFLMKDAEMNEVCAPFPQYFKKNRLWDTFSSNEESLIKSASKMSIEMNTKLDALIVPKSKKVKGSFFQRIGDWFRSL